MAGRPRIPALEKLRRGTFLRKRDLPFLCIELGIDDPEEAYRVGREKAGVPVRGRGRPRKSIEEHKRNGTYKPSRHKGETQEDDRHIIDVVGFTPRRQLKLALDGVEGFEDPGVRSDGAWFARFTEELCTLYEGAQFRGKPMVLAPHWRAFFEDALAFDDNGNRIYETIVAEVPRKCAKSHTCGAFGLAVASPCEGEGAPSVVLASGTAKQAQKVFQPASLFVKKNPVLRNTFKPYIAAITCEENDGSIYRIAADGDTQYGEGPYVNICDELHIWTQPKQVGLWAALRSAHGARENYLDCIISTAGSDETTIFGEMRKYAREHPLTEFHAEMGDGGFILRDRESKVLFYGWEVKPETELDDLEAWKRANPADWRTIDRLAVDLADPLLDESDKRRQYGNEWTSAACRWIGVDKWRHTLAKGATPNPSGEPDDFIPAGVDIHVGVDAAITHDTTAVAWAWKAPSGKVRVRVRVWCVRQELKEGAHYHVFVPGGRLDNEEGAEAFIRDVLAKNYRVRTVVYDPRYFETEAKHLSRAGLWVADLPQASGAMWDARAEFYRTVVEERIEHDGESVFAAHVGAANGKKLRNGWDVYAESEDKPIDALTAAIMAVFRAVRAPEVKPWVMHA